MRLTGHWAKYRVRRCAGMAVPLADIVDRVICVQSHLLGQKALAVVPVAHEPLGGGHRVRTGIARGHHNHLRAPPRFHEDAPVSRGAC